MSFTFSSQLWKWRLLVLVQDNLQLVHLCDQFTKQWQYSQCSNFQASAFSLYSAQHQWFNGGSLHYSYLCRDIIALQHYRPLQWYQISMPSHHSLSSSLTTIALLIFPLSTSVHTALAMVPWINCRKSSCLRQSKAPSVPSCTDYLSSLLALWSYWYRPTSLPLNHWNNRCKWLCNLTIRHLLSCLLVIQHQKFRNCSWSSVIW